MKFCLVSNSPNVRTGYGVQAAYLTSLLLEHGHEPAVAANYGCQGAIQTWQGVRIYPVGYEATSNDVIHEHAAHWFDGDPLGGWVVTLLDVWALVNPRLAEFNVAAWVPVDHFPVPPGVLNFFSRTQAVPVAMSKFGQRLLFDAGLDPVYIPLSVDTTEYRPTVEIEHEGTVYAARDVFKIPHDAFVVGMVAMNKGWAKDRKGFNEAFWAFGQFLKSHPDAVLFVHAEKWGGAEGQNLPELAIHAGIPDTNIVFSDQYAYRVGFTNEMMAALYSSFDVLLAPSHGEGFCVPLVEAQACGTPVIASDFSAQTELVGAGWLLRGQPEWDPAQHAAYVCPIIDDVVGKLHDAHDALADVDTREALATKAVEFAAEYDTRRVFETYWVPFIESLSEPGDTLTLDREPMPATGAVAVLCPVRNRPENVKPLVESFLANTEGGTATLYLIGEGAEEGAYQAALDEVVPPTEAEVKWLPVDGVSFAEKLNAGYRESTPFPWVLCIGDDVRFHPGWLDEARKLSDRYDVIGTNDTAGKVKNPKVASGAHADHFFVRRAYVEEHGASLDGPGILAPEAYRHWYTDMEIIRLAKARGVFSPCLESVVEHLHPAYDGDEEARKADATYMEAVEYAADDDATWRSRMPLVEMQRTTRSKVR